MRVKHKSGRICKEARSSMRVVPREIKTLSRPEIVIFQGGFLLYRKFIRILITTKNN